MSTLLYFFIAIGENVGVVLKNDATAQIKSVASFFYLL